MCDHHACRRKAVHREVTIGVTASNSKFNEPSRGAVGCSHSVAEEDNYVLGAITEAKRVTDFELGIDRRSTSRIGKGRENLVNARLEIRITAQIEAPETSRSDSVGRRRILVTGGEGFGNAVNRNCSGKRTGSFAFDAQIK